MELIVQERILGGAETESFYQTIIYDSYEGKKWELVHQTLCAQIYLSEEVSQQKEDHYVNMP